MLVNYRGDDQQSIRKGIYLGNLSSVSHCFLSSAEPFTILSSLQGPGQDQLGIYIRSVVKGGAAYKVCFLLNYCSSNYVSDLSLMCN